MAQALNLLISQLRRDQQARACGFFSGGALKKIFVYASLLSIKKNIFFFIHRYP
jgi:hypothetical protein